MAAGTETYFTSDPTWIVDPIGKTCCGGVIPETH